MITPHGGFNMEFYCTNCGRKINTWDKAYFSFQLPEKGITEIQAFLNLNAKAFCSQCVSIKHNRSEK